uniref:Cell death abnormality protein 1 n=1 Tax=Phallusia mammillata TaxID=59560 RepID=A0A6F9DVK0_9ASCI|nr:cell death abnormality protein 1 [Phallusia mammillata]
MWPSTCRLEIVTKQGSIQQISRACGKSGETEAHALDCSISSSYDLYDSYYSSVERTTCTSVVLGIVRWVAVETENVLRASACVTMDLPGLTAVLQEWKKMEREVPVDQSQAWCYSLLQV